MNVILPSSVTEMMYCGQLYFPYVYPWGNNLRYMLN